MIRPRNSNSANLFQWYAADGGVEKDTLVKEDSGAKAVAAEHSGATIIGIAMEKQETQNAVCVIHPIKGSTFEVDFDPTATKQSCTAADLGKSYEMKVASDEQFIDLDDTSASGFLYLVGYDNKAKKAYCAVADADCLLHI